MLLGQGLAWLTKAAGRGAGGLAQGVTPWEESPQLWRSRNSVGSGVPTSLRSPGVSYLLVLPAAGCLPVKAGRPGRGILNLPLAMGDWGAGGGALQLTEPL